MSAFVKRKNAPNQNYFSADIRHLLRKAPKNTKIISLGAWTICPTWCIDLGIIGIPRARVHSTLTPIEKNPNA